MALHEKVFYSTCFFLFGVTAASILSDSRYWLIFSVCLAIFVASICLAKNRKLLAGLTIFIVIGASYYFLFEHFYKLSFQAPLNQQISFSLQVSSVLTQPGVQKINGQLQRPYSGKIRVFHSSYPQVKYGDVLHIKAILKPLKEEAKDYFAKEGISATVSFPKELSIINQHQGSKIKTLLFSIRNSVQERISQHLSSSQSTFMSGLLLGKSAGFSKEFSEKMKLTGTTHLVALSGYNVAIIATGIFFLFGRVFGRRRAFYLAIVSILGFVLMTGAEASVVRAGIMASIMFLASHVGRMYSLRNAIAISALIMVLFNPRVLVFDIGFQLSFLAFLGIVYIKPSIENTLGIQNKKGLFSWKENLLTTLSAQCAVLPILFINFEFFSPISILTNVLILTFIPLTMLLGFLIFLFSLLSNFLASIVAIPASILLNYELNIINIFSQFNMGLTIKNFSLPTATLYYIALIAFITLTKKRYAKL